MQEACAYGTYVYEEVLGGSGLRTTSEVSCAQCCLQFKIAHKLPGVCTVSDCSGLQSSMMLAQILKLTFEVTARSCPHAHRSHLGSRRVEWAAQGALQGSTGRAPFLLVVSVPQTLGVLVALPSCSRSPRATHLLHRFVAGRQTVESRSP